MNKKLILFFLSGTLLFISCRKEYGYYENMRLNIDLGLQDALYGFEEITEGDFTPTKNQCLRAQFFIYDDAGQLVIRQERTVADYYTTVECDLERIDLGNYTLITATDMLETVDGTLQPIYWDFTGTGTLSTFTVTGLDALDTMGERTLTLNRTEFTIDGRRKAKSLYLNAEPITAMICVTYFDIFHWDKNLVGGESNYRIFSYFDITYDHDMNEVCYACDQRNQSWIFREATDNEYYILDRLVPDNLGDVSTIYGYHALLPGKYSFRGYGEYSYRGMRVVYPDETPRPTSQLSVQSGRQYYVDFDIKEWTIAFEESTATRTAEGVSTNGVSVRALDIPAQTLCKNGRTAANRMKR